jgi:predicted enzyme related to lactoylglutathione lyase
LADTPVPGVGQIGWVDLTVPNAGAIREFYEHVTGWTSTPLSMGDYSDYCMSPPGADKPVAGVCHALGQNAAQPPVWMIYIMVADLDESVRRCLERGGKIRVAERKMPGSGRFCIIEDPAGAVAGLFQAE